jgi:C4-dicarboxylate-specific signal transduction histidine kinase
LDVSEVSFPVIAAEKPIGFYFILRDITESKRASEKLQKTQAELAHLSRITTMGELAASIAHEINQPIAAMVTNGNAAMRWLSHNPPDLEGAEEALGCIVRDANRAAQVIWRIRSLLAKTPTPMVELNVNDVIREVMALTAFESSRRGASVATELADNLPVVNGDRVQLQQVLLNLIMNSLDSLNSVTDRTRELRIKSSQTEDGVLVQVLDSGRGWEKEHAARIFDPFFTTRKDGIGMGLTISRSIVETHGGRLWAESGKPHGAIMNFILPVGTRPE